ncbi:MAG: C10 family peptidase [Tannerellaceae bacterium]|jgi:hypothetical protein|nr:C10 family peptidase [Tannerellaceae bacterium]
MTFSFFLVATFLFSCNNISEDNIIRDEESKESHVMSQTEAESELLRFINPSGNTKSDIIFKIAGCNFRDYQISDTQSELEVIDSTPTETVRVFEFTTLTNGKEGYSLVIGDSRIEKVLLSVEYGSPADTNLIYPLKLFFRSIPDIIKEDLKNYNSGERTISIQTKAVVFHEESKLSTRWSQKYPYNALCPSSTCSPLECNNHYPTGCVPLAIAQILAYHGKPSNLSWTSILAGPTVPTNASSTVINQIAGLIANIGSSVSVSYGCTASGVSPSLTPTVVPATFRSYGMTHGSWQGFSLFEIKYSLLNQMPVYMEGFSSGNGHAWVCDAYKIHDGMYDYLHMNWGWGGTSNGYFYISNSLSFNTGNYNYNQDFRMLPNIR